MEETGGATDVSTRSDALATPSVDGVVVWANSGRTGLNMQTADVKAMAAAILIVKSGQRSGSFLGMADVLGSRPGFQPVNVMPSSQFRNSPACDPVSRNGVEKEQKSIANNDGELKRRRKAANRKSPAALGQTAFPFREPVRSLQL